MRTEQHPAQQQREEKDTMLENKVESQVQAFEWLHVTSMPNHSLRSTGRKHVTQSYWTLQFGVFAQQMIRTEREAVVKADEMLCAHNGLIDAVTAVPILHVIWPLISVFLSMLL
jgi:hypothetical protein